MTRAGPISAERLRAYPSSDQERRWELLRFYAGDLERAREAEAWLWGGAGSATVVATGENSRACGGAGSVPTFSVTDSSGTAPKPEREPGPQDAATTQDAAGHSDWLGAAELPVDAVAEAKPERVARSNPDDDLPIPDFLRRTRDRGEGNGLAPAQKPEHLDERAERAAQ